MIEVLVGHLVDTEPQWSETRGRLVYVDRTTRLFWISRPLHLDEEYVGLLLGGRHIIRLGRPEASSTDGCLAYLELDARQVSEIDASKSLDLLTNDPRITIPDNITLTQSLHEYIQTGEPAHEILRSIAWYASLHFAEVKQHGLSHALQKVTLDDLARLCSADAQRLIGRDSQLSKELLRFAETRRLVFVLGGTKSGLSSFLEQFKNALPKQDPAGTHLSADFSPDSFRGMQAFLRGINQTGQVEPLSCDIDTASLFISLGYAAYQSLLTADGIEYASLANFVPRAAEFHAGDFALQYLGEFARHRARVRDSSQVEPFLLFVGRMMEAAGKRGTLTVVLSFPGLTKWLRETQGQDVAARVSRSLWAELKSFTNANYDTMSGEPKPGSVMSSFRHDVGVVVEIQRLSFPDISDAFCRQSVLVMPPFSDDELATVWRQRTHIAPTPAMLAEIRRLTGGAPWFVDLLLDCFEASPGNNKRMEDHGVEQLKAAADLAESILLNRTLIPPRPQLEKIKQTWMLYVEDLTSRMSAQALTDRTTLLDLFRASKLTVMMPHNAQAAEWLESGLIWLRHPTRKHTLTALDKYPFFLAFPQAELISVFIKFLTTPEARREMVS